jgi:3',5'-cyclic AMP phosphodiesterase CpdA
LAKVNGVRNKTNEFYGDKLYRYHCGYGSAKATYYDFDCGGWKFIVLDSGGMIGTIEPAQMSWLKNVLKKTDASTPIILFIHGPLYPFFGDSPESTKLVTNYKAVIDAFKDK